MRPDCNLFQSSNEFTSDSIELEDSRIKLIYSLRSLSVNESSFSKSSVNPKIELNGVRKSCETIDKNLSFVSFSFIRFSLDFFKSSSTFFRMLISLTIPYNFLTTPESSRMRFILFLTQTIFPYLLIILNSISVEFLILLFIISFIFLQIQEELAGIFSFPKYHELSKRDNFPHLIQIPIRKLRKTYLFHLHVYQEIQIYLRHPFFFG